MSYLFKFKQHSLTPTLQLRNTRSDIDFLLPSHTTYTLQFLMSLPSSTSYELQPDTMQRVQETV